MPKNFVILKISKPVKNANEAIKVFKEIKEALAHIPNITFNDEKPTVTLTH